jgi:uncharacterized membrane protein
MLAAAIAVLLLVLAVLAAPWARLRDGQLRNAWAATCAALMLIWQMDVVVAGGLSLHLSGAAVLTLIGGPWLAIVGLGVVSVATAAVAWAGATPVEDWALRFLAAGGVPVLLTWAVVRGLRRFAPVHPFVYIFGNGFFAAGLALAGGALVAGLLALAAGRIGADGLGEAWLPAAGLLAFAEAWLSGMIVTLLVVYRPHWLSSFDAGRYLAKRDI